MAVWGALKTIARPLWLAIDAGLKALALQRIASRAVACVEL